MTIISKEERAQKALFLERNPIPMDPVFDRPIIEKHFNLDRVANKY